MKIDQGKSFISVVMPFGLELWLWKLTHNFFDGLGHFPFCKVDLDWEQYGLIFLIYVSNEGSSTMENRWKKHERNLKKDEKKMKIYYDCGISTEQSLWFALSWHLWVDSTKTRWTKEHYPLGRKYHILMTSIFVIKLLFSRYCKVNSNWVGHFNHPQILERPGQSLWSTASSGHK